MEEKENKIYTSAIKLFWKYWPKKVSIDDIIKEAEVWKWTFYKYFSNKENLYKIIIDNIFFEKDQEKIDKKFESLQFEEIIISHFLWYLYFTENNIFLKNLLLENKEYFFWEIDFDYIRKINHKMALEKLKYMKIDDSDRINLVENIYIFIKICLAKKDILSQEKYDDFCLNYANIFTFWYLQNKNFLKINLQDFRKDLSDLECEKNIYEI